MVFWIPFKKSNDSLGHLRRVDSFINEAERWLDETRWKVAKSRPAVKYLYSEMYYTAKITELANNISSVFG